jgi:hypothetical protein
MMNKMGRFPNRAVRYTAFKTVMENGTKKKLQKTFFQELHPTNTLPDGKVKTHADIMKELLAEAREWERQ